MDHDFIRTHSLAKLGLQNLVLCRAVSKTWKACVESNDVEQLSQDTCRPLIVLTGGGEYPTDRVSLRFGRAGAWFAGPCMPEPRTRHGCVSVGRKVYVVGGYGAGRKQATTTLVYDVWTATWRALPGLALPRHSHATFALPDGRIMAAGGYNVEAMESTATCELFDPDAERWGPAAPLAEHRYWAHACVLDGSPHVVCGVFGEFGTVGVRRTVERYDVARDTWEFAPPLSRRLRCSEYPSHGCAAAVGGALYLFTSRSGTLSYRPRPLEILRRVAWDGESGTTIPGSRVGPGCSFQLDDGRPAAVLGTFDPRPLDADVHGFPVDVVAGASPEDDLGWKRVPGDERFSGNFDQSTCVAIDGGVLVLCGNGRYFLDCATGAWGPDPSPETEAEVRSYMSFNQAHDAEDAAVCVVK